MIRKISFISISSFTMLFCMLISVATFANNKPTKAKKAKTIEQPALQQNVSIAEVYVNLNYTYVPLSTTYSLQQIHKGQLATANDQNIFMITKDDYHYYFQKSNNSFQFMYAVKDNNIQLFDGFEYENEIKIAMGNQLFTFDMMNGRPVDLNAENSNTNLNLVANTN